MRTAKKTKTALPPKTRSTMARRIPKLTGACPRLTCGLGPAFYGRRKRAAGARLAFGTTHTSPYGIVRVASMEQLNFGAVGTA